MQYTDYDIETKKQSKGQRGGVRIGAGRKKSEQTRTLRSLRAYDDEWHLISKFADAVKHGHAEKCKNFLGGIINET